MQDTEMLPSAASIGRVGLRVDDRDRLATFYEDVVGLTTLHRGADTATLGTDGEALLVLTEHADQSPRGPAETGLFHVAVRVPTRAALAGTLERVEDRWELTGASDHRVSEALYFDDPAGNGVEVYYDRPRDEWPTTDDGQVQMETLPLDLSALRESSTGASRVPAETTVGHVHLEVAALTATEEWYTRGLGMGIRQRYGTSALFLAAGDYHHHVGANVWNGRSEPGTGLGLDWFEVRVPDEETVSAADSRLRSLGTDSTPVPDGIGVEDPDGIEVRIVCRD